jgi:hypothetical protein
MSVIGFPHSMPLPFVSTRTLGSAHLSPTTCISGGVLLKGDGADGRALLAAKGEAWVLDARAGKRWKGTDQRQKLRLVHAVRRAWTTHWKVKPGTGGSDRVGQSASVGARSSRRQLARTDTGTLKACPDLLLGEVAAGDEEEAAGLDKRRELARVQLGRRQVQRRQGRRRERDGVVRP